MSTSSSPIRYAATMEPFRLPNPPHDNNREADNERVAPHETGRASPTTRKKNPAIPARAPEDGPGERVNFSHVNAHKRCAVLVLSCR
jgi:hypothetical protein